MIRPLPTHPQQVRASLRGFTLLEMSIVLLILALLSGGVLNLAAQTIRTNKYKEVTRKMDVIEEALLDFAQQQKRLPCPADGTRAPIDVWFGIEGSGNGPPRCITGTPSANATDGVNTVGGVVPTRALGLPDEYQFNPWGGRFTYTVDARATQDNALTIYPITNTAIGSITVYDIASNIRTTKAIAVIISHGPNGHGAYQLSGIRKSSGSQATPELVNCGCNSANPPVADGTYFFTPQAVMSQNYAISTNNAFNFDDIVRYYTRPMIPLSTDLLTETR